MKKIYKFSLFLVSLLVSIQNVYGIDFSILNNKETSCPVSNINDVVYIPIGSDSYTTKIYDAFWANKDRYIANAGSLAKLWAANPGLVSCGTWNRYSEVAPGNNIKVVAFASDCTFNKVNTPNKSVQFVFNVRHGQIGGGTATVNKQYYTLAGWFQSPAQISYKTYNNYYVSNYKLDGNECYNLRIAWCGDGILETDKGEICDDGNNVDGDGCDSTCKPESVKNPQVQIDKRDANNADLDKVIGNDSQMLRLGDEAVFKIRVTNNGQENLKNIVLTDSLAPNCAGNVTLASGIPSTWSNFTLGGAGNHSDSLLQVGEWFEYTCSKPNTTGNYTNQATVKANGETSNKEVTSTDTSPVLTIVPAIQIDKRDANNADLDKVIGNDTQTVKVGSEAIFKIKVTNNSSEAIDNIVLTDSLAPNCAGNITLPSGIPSTWLNFAISGTGNHSDNILNPGESFEYTCTRENTQSDYTNTVIVNGKGVTSSTDVSATDTSPVLTTAPAIFIDKRDANANDLDGNIGNDTQTVRVGSEAVFRIRVTNTSKEALKNINLTDPLAPNCGGNVILPGVYPQTFLSFVTGGAGDHTNNTLDEGEWFEYTCNKENTQVGYTNQVSVNAIGVNTNETVTATDTTPVLLNQNIIPGILIDKRDANTNDLDGNIGNDTQTVNRGSEAVFKIRVTNNGYENLRNIVLTDAMAPSCGGNVTLPGVYPSSWSSFVTGGNGDKTNDVLEPGEWFEYVCTQANTQNNYTNQVSVNAIGVISNTNVSASDTTPVIISGIGNPTVQVDKRDANPNDIDGVIGNDTQTVITGKEAIFRIRVVNNGTEDLKNIRMQDYMAPNCAGNVNLPYSYPSMWSSFTLGGAGNHSDGVLQVGEWFEYTCNKENTQFSYTNQAIVNAVGVTSNKEVSANDTTEIRTGGAPSIDIDKRDANTNDLDGNIGNDTQTVNYGAQAVFKIKITNSGQESLKNLRVEDFNAPNCGGSLTLPNSYPNTWSNFSISGNGNHGNDILEPGESFEYTCLKDNTTTDYINSATVYGIGVVSNTPTNDTDTSPVYVDGAGSSQLACIRISIPSLEALGKGKALANPGNVEITCYGDTNTNLIGIDCNYNGGTPNIDFSKPAISQGATRQASFTCSYPSTDRTYHPKCFVGGAKPTVTSLACGTHISVGKNYCGDGVLQRPNSNGQMEECEKQNGVFPSWCNDDCTTKNFTYPASGTGFISGILTYPAEGSVYVRPIGKVIIGAGVNPFNIIGTSPYIGNDSAEDLYLDRYLCVYNSNKSSILKEDNTELDFICSAKKIGWLYPGVKKSYKDLNNGVDINLKGAKITGTDYKDTVLKVSIDGARDAYFASELNVRISRAAIATIGGGTTLINNSNLTADISKLASGGYSDSTKNKNFVGVGISTGNISSYTKNITNSGSVTSIYSGQTIRTQTNLDRITTNRVSGTKSITDNLDSYNGLSNVYILKDGNLNINAEVPGTGVKTYIVENGDILINKDINYADNIAFVVKGGNIIIDESVTNIKGTFITIKKNNIGGKIISDETQNKLLINGSLYGDLEELVNNRTHISNKNDMLNVGTIVSYGSNIFRQQAPLVGDFIDEYLESKKIAR